MFIYIYGMLNAYPALETHFNLNYCYTYCVAYLGTNLTTES